MWQDEFISKRDGDFVCWDQNGEFIATAYTLIQARLLLTEYVNIHYKDNTMQDLYNNLLALSNNDDTPFYHSDQTKHDSIYRIFAYHFTDKDSWLLEDALESRGIMFEINRSGEMLRIASRPMQKFFNKGEVDFIEYSEAETVMDKADGSLISSYLDKDGTLCLKSKASLHSDHCVAAMDFLARPINQMLNTFLNEMEDEGYTVNMEWVSPHPDFRIVIYYAQADLIILNARHRETGEYYDQRLLKTRMTKRVVDLYPDTSIINHLEDRQGVEGYVVIDTNNNWYKLKTAWYLERHRAKDFVNRPVEFVKLVLKEEADDVFALVEDQPELHDEMVLLQHQVTKTANTIVNTVTKYWEENNELNRKDYAIKGQSELHGFEFPLAMQYYSNGSEPNWTEFLLNVVKKINWGIDLEEKEEV